MKRVLLSVVIVLAMVLPARAVAAPMTLAEYEKLIIALAACSAVETETTYYGWVEGACPAHKALSARKSEKNAMTGLGDTGPLMRKMLGHAAPAVRVYAAQMMESLLGTSAENLRALTEAAKTEKDIAVLKAILHASWNKAKSDAEVGAMLLTCAAHGNPRVRATAAVGLSSPWNKGMKSAVAKLSELMEKDPDPKVRKAACSHAGKLNDDSLLSVYDRLTAPAADKELAAECMTGLVGMWASFPLWEDRNEKAYRLTLRRFEQVPRHDKMPPWSVMSTIASIGTGSGSAFEKWKTEATWFDAAAVRRVLASIVVDPQANWMARTGAVKAAIALGATKADLTRWKAGLKPDGDNGFVIREIDAGMAKAK